MSGPAPYTINADSWQVDAPYDGGPEEWRAWANRMPISQAIGLRCGRIEPGFAEFTLAEPPLGIPNPNGSIHGGLLVAAADQCMGIVSMTVLEPTLLPVTAGIHAQFHRPAIPPVKLEGRVTKGGRSLVFIEVEARDRDGRRCLSSQGTMMVVRYSVAGDRDREIT